MSCMFCTDTASVVQRTGMTLRECIVQLLSILARVAGYPRRQLDEIWRVGSCSSSPVARPSPDKDPDQLLPRTKTGAIPAVPRAHVYDGSSPLNEGHVSREHLFARPYQYSIHEIHDRMVAIHGFSLSGFPCRSGDFRRALGGEKVRRPFACCPLGGVFPCTSGSPNASA